MKELRSRALIFFYKYKWYIIPAGIILLFSLLFLANQATQQPVGLQEKDAQEITGEPGQDEKKPDSDSHADIDIYETEKLEKKEALPDGSTKYTTTSSVETRPHIAIVDTNDVVLFERSVISQDDHISLSDYLAAYGTPESVVKGHPYYGHGVDVYVYAKKGLAFIAFEPTDSVFELHTFPPMTVDEYLKNYGETDFSKHDEH